METQKSTFNINKKLLTISLGLTIMTAAVSLYTSYSRAKNRKKCKCQEKK